MSLVGSEGGERKERFWHVENPPSSGEIGWKRRGALGAIRGVWQLICGRQDRARYTILLLSDTKAVASQNYHF